MRYRACNTRLPVGRENVHLRPHQSLLLYRILVPEAFARIVSALERLDRIAELAVIGDVAVLPRNVQTVGLAVDIAPAQTAVGHATGHDQVAGGIAAIDRLELSIVLQQL